MKNLVVIAGLFMLLSGEFGYCVKNKRPKKEQKALKILVLIIASDDLPVYKELQNIWRSYMHLDPQHVEAYFMKADSDLSVPLRIEGDTIWVKTQENLLEGLTNKTILSMESFLPRLPEFDYILRPNLSSFYVFPRLLKFLQTCPKTNFYGGSSIGNGKIGSGCGFLLSSDLVEFLVTNKAHFINNRSAPDDVLIGKFLIRHGKRLTLHDRLDLMPISVWYRMRDRIPQSAFHFRIKNEASLRLSHDIYTHTHLLKMFYGIENVPTDLLPLLALQPRACWLIE